MFSTSSSARRRAIPPAIACVALFCCCSFGCDARGAGPPARGRIGRICGARLSAPSPACVSARGFRCVPAFVADLQRVLRLPLRFRHVHDSGAASLHQPLWARCASFCLARACPHAYSRHSPLPILWGVWPRPLRGASCARRGEGGRGSAQTRNVPRMVRRHYGPDSTRWG